MKLFTLLLFVCFSLVVCAQNSLSVTMTGIGNIKIGMKLADVEKLSGQPIKLNNILKDDWTYDTVATRINDVDLASFSTGNMSTKKNIISS